MHVHKCNSHTTVPLNSFHIYLAEALLANVFTVFRILALGRTDGRPPSWRIGTGANLAGSLVPSHSCHLWKTLRQQNVKGSSYPMISRRPNACDRETLKERSPSWRETKRHHRQPRDPVLVPEGEWESGAGLDMPPRVPLESRLCHRRGNPESPNFQQFQTLQTEFSLQVL